jgi:hypothetical protein
MIDSVAPALGCSHGLACSIVHDHLKFLEVCAGWVPREQKDRDREKMNRTDLPLQHLLWYVDEGEDMCNRIVSGDKSWVHHYQHKSKCASVQWKHPIRLHHHLGGLCVPCFGILKEYCYPITEVWWKCELCIILWSSIESSGCSSQTTSRPIWHEGYCFIMTVPDRIQPEQPRREFKNYNGNFLNNCLTAQIWPLVTSICLIS